MKFIYTFTAVGLAVPVTAIEANELVTYVRRQNIWH